MPAAMAMPPTLGTGAACTLRAPGRSVRPTRNAQRCSPGMHAVVMDRAMSDASSNSTAHLHRQPGGSSPQLERLAIDEVLVPRPQQAEGQSGATLEHPSLDEIESREHDERPGGHTVEPGLLRLPPPQWVGREQIAPDDVIFGVSG